MEHGTRHSWRARRHITVGAYEPGRRVPDPDEDAALALGQRSPGSLRGYCEMAWLAVRAVVTIRFCSSACATG
jgi:hypothetical protein